MPLPENNQATENNESAEQDALVNHKTMEIPASVLAAALAGSEPIPPQAELPDNALIDRSPRPARSANGQKRRLKPWLALLILAAAVPLVLTAIGALTSPPHVRGIPSGHLIYLEADAPSEHTTTLRGLFAAGPDGATHLLVHETEPQDTDDGQREWITQPTLSPDGTQIAFEEQLITLQDDRQAIDNQLYVMPLSPGPQSKPRLVIDLTKQNLKQVVGLAWDSNSSLLFLEDGASYSVPTDPADPPLITPLDLQSNKMAVTSGVSATRFPALSAAGTFAYGVQTAAGPQVLLQVQGQTVPGPAAAIFALSPSDDRIAFVSAGSEHAIQVYDIARMTYSPKIPVRWGWSVFGRRKITSLRWSPDGTQIAFTVSKPPVPDDEMFVVTLATGETVQLPYRTGRSAWDWGK